MSPHSPGFTYAANESAGVTVSAKVNMGTGACAQSSCVVVTSPSTQPGAPSTTRFMTRFITGNSSRSRPHARSDRVRETGEVEVAHLEPRDDEIRGRANRLAPR